MNNKPFILKPMNPHQILADNAKDVARKQQDNPHLIVNESQCKKKREETKLTLLATKSELREIHNNPYTIHYVLICKGPAKDTNTETKIPPV